MLEVWATVAASLTCGCLHVNANGFVIVLACTIIVLLLTTEFDRDPYVPFSADDVSAKAAKTEEEEVTKVPNPRRVQEEVALPQDAGAESKCDTTSPGPRHWAALTARRSKECEQRLRSKMMLDFFDQYKKYSPAQKQTP